MTLPRFYPIFDSAERVIRAAELGVKFMQLRIKDASEAKLRTEISVALSACDLCGAEVVINDHWLLAVDYCARWVHLGQEDLDSANIRLIRSAGLRLGISTHDCAELDRALELEPDYVALGPVYPTVLKEMPWAPQGLDRLAEWKRRIGKTPLCAIGGMSVERAPGAFDAGADLVSAVTDISLHPDPEARILEWLKVCG